MKIDKKRPLPDHTKLDYDECCAYLILKELFPDKYSDLEIKDKPDLQCDELGIEVTIATDRKYQEALNNWVKACNCEDDIKRQKYITRMKQLGVVYTGGIQSWPIYAPSIEMISKAVRSKITKLQKGDYRKYDHYELFVFSDLWMHEGVLNKVIEMLNDNGAFEFFNKIYILEIGYVLHIFEKDNYSFIEIDKEEQSNRNIRAREMVEIAEESE